MTSAVSELALAIRDEMSESFRSQPSTRTVILRRRAQAALSAVAALGEHGVERDVGVVHEQQPSASPLRVSTI